MIRLDLIWGGVLFKIGDIEYFAPLSSPKTKHQKMNNSIDFHKIENEFKQNGKKEKELIGVINFNNMIPVMSYNYKLINFNTKCKNEAEKKYFSLLYLDFIFI